MLVSPGNCDRTNLGERWREEKHSIHVDRQMKGMAVIAKPTCGALRGRGFMGAALFWPPGRNCMSGTPAATIRATNSSASMLRELELIVSMKDAAEYCRES